MVRVPLCKDGLRADLESQNGLWIVLSDSGSGESFGRFTVDPSELKATIDGNAAYQASDGSGNSVSIDGEGQTLKIRVEGPNYSTTRCLLAPSVVEELLEALRNRA